MLQPHNCLQHQDISAPFTKSDTLLKIIASAQSHKAFGCHDTPDPSRSKRRTHRGASRRWARVATEAAPQACEGGVRVSQCYPMSRMVWPRAISARFWPRRAAMRRYGAAREGCWVFAATWAAATSPWRRHRRP
jgi:hypothetical protein